MKRAIPAVTKTKELRPAALGYADAARYCGLAEKTLRNRVCNRSFPVRPRKFGSKPLFLVSELDEFLKSLPSD